VGSERKKEEEGHKLKEKPHPRGLLIRDITVAKGGVIFKPKRRRNMKESICWEKAKRKEIKRRGGKISGLPSHRAVGVPYCLVGLAGPYFHGIKKFNAEQE